MQVIRKLVAKCGDHRICMSSFVLASYENLNKNFEMVASSPSFLKIMKSLGAKFVIQNKFIQISCDVELPENLQEQNDCKNIN